MAEKPQAEFGGQDPFAAFKTGQPPASEGPADPNATTTATAETGKKKRGRKKAADGNGTAAAKDTPSVLMVPVTAMADLVELDPDQIKLFTAIAGKISDLPKGRAKHLVAALSKLFS